MADGGKRVAVIGGGLAGITAALRCADAGRAVTLVESRPRLGGLATSFRRGDLDVDNGQHVFLRCCTAYRRLLDRLGMTGAVHLQERMDIPVLAPGQEPARLRRTALPAPLHLAGALLGYRPLPRSDRLRLVAAAVALRGVDRFAPATDRHSFGDWLAAHGQSRRSITALWDVVGIATLNARADDASLALAATVFQLGLLTDRAAADIGWATVPLARLHDTAAGAALAAAGVQVRTGAKVRALDRTAQGWRLTVDRSGTEETIMAADVVCAVPPHAAQRLLPAGALSLPTGWAARLGTTPIVNVHVVYDRRVLDAPFAAGVDTPVQWIFDRTAAAGLRRVRPAPAQYLAVSLSAADDLVGMTAKALLARMLPALVQLLPAARSATVLDAFVTREPHATFRSAPGQAALRPSAGTREPGLVVAGAWTATGWPATMEGAARSGESAAEALLHAGSPARAGAAA